MSIKTKLENVTLVKIDVDGYEIDVLKGGRDFFINQQPIIIMELAPYTLEERGKSLCDLLDVVKGMGYCMVDQKSKKPIAMTPEKIKTTNPRRWVNKCYRKTNLIKNMTLQASK